MQKPRHDVVPCSPATSWYGSENYEITFDLNGEVKLLGVDNGSNSNLKDFRPNNIVTNQGRSLLKIQSTKKNSSFSDQK